MEKIWWQEIGERCARHGRALRCAVWLMALVAAVLPASAVTFTASLDRDTITFGESVGLSLTFDGAQPEGTPTIPSIPNLQIAYNGPSSQISFVNGQVSSKITHNFTVTPRQPGDYTIPPLRYDVAGQQLVTQPIQLKVLKPGAPPPGAVAAGSQPVFLRLQLPKTNVYLGEIIHGEFQLYLRDGVLGASQFQFTATPTEGFSVGKMLEGQKRRMQIGSSGYTVVPISVLLTPNKTGPLSIGPVTASVVIELRSNNRRRDPFVDPLGMFSNNQRQQIALATEAQTVQCLPLPEEDKPVNFNGAVGNYTMTVSVGPTNVATGDPITVRVRISGTGALNALTLPEQTAWHDFKTYPPTASVETTDPIGLQGTKTFEQIITPESTDIKALPAFSFSYFDPETRTYHTLRQPAVPLEVRPGGSAPPPVIAATAKPASDTPPTPQDIVPIKTRLGTVTSTHPAISRQKVFLALNTVPALAFLAVLVWRKRTAALANNPRRRRHREVAETLRTGLEQLREHAAQNRSDDFFAGLVHLLQEKLGERLDCPASAITEAVVEEKLRPRGLPDSTLDELRALFQACNLARYAPIQSSHELAALIPRLENVLKKLEEMKT